MWRRPPLMAMAGVALFVTFSALLSRVLGRKRLRADAGGGTDHAEADAALVASQTGATVAEAREALRRNAGDIANAVLALTGAAAPAVAPAAAASASSAPPAKAKRAAAAASEASHVRRSRGSAVLLQNLQAKPELNGMEGRVLSFDEAKGRYAVRLLPTPNLAARTLHVRPSNLVDAPSKNNNNWTALELCAMCLDDHGCMAPEHMQRSVELMSGQAGQLTELQLSQLLRCVCCFEWHIAALRDRKSGAETHRLLPHPEHGKGFVLVFEAARFKKIAAVADAPTPRGKEPCILTTTGAQPGTQFFLSGALGGETTYISLAPEDPTHLGPGRFTILTPPVFNALNYIAAGLRLEAALAEVVAACGADGSAPKGTPPPAVTPCAATELFVGHVFFCFDTGAAQGTGTVQPLNAVADEGSFMMLFTGPELLEMARPTLEGLGAFAVAPHTQIAQVPARNVHDCLTAAGAMHAGVAINPYVPNLAERYMAPGLRTANLRRVFEAHGVVV